MASPKNSEKINLIKIGKLVGAQQLIKRMIK